MGFRTVILKKKYKIETSNNYLVIRDTKERKDVLLDEIASVIFQSPQISVTVPALAKLSEKNINVIICDEKYNPIAELINYNGIYDSREKIVKQFEFNKETIDECWSLIIKEKIANQLKILKKYSKNETSIQLLADYIKNVEKGDITNREGHAAKVYFNTLFDKDFSRDKECEINVYLNYGYTIILSCFNRSIRALGYYPELGIHHIGKENPFNLSCDFMEPVRQFVDSYILSNRVNPQNYKFEFVDMLNQMVDYDGDKMYLENAIRLYCKMLLSSIGSNQLNKVKFIQYDI